MNRQNRNALLWAAAGVGAWLVARSVVRSHRYYDLRGKVVLITGGSRGLGLLLARAFAREGARVAICSRDPEELVRAEEDLRQRGAAVCARACDITEPGQAEACVRAVRDQFGRLDVLVNNAGVIQVGPMETMTVSDYQEAMQAHYWGPVYLTLAALPDMRRRREGRIVNISSIGGKISVPHLLPYSGSKFALVGFSEGLRAELAKDNIRVTTVCPGLMRTGSPDNAFFKGQHRAEYTWFTLSDALPGLSMSAERAARQIVRACQYGEAELALSLPAKVAIKFHDLFPGLTADLLGLVNELLPGPGGIGTARATGKESHSRLAPSFLTTLSDRAAEQNNETAAGGLAPSASQRPASRSSGVEP